MTHKNSIPNKLINEKSPYLLQHAYNPVDWYPWGEEAFEKARKEDKPIFLSVGYSSCHWCHVMERESFEDRETADILNKYFVSIKLDREERPDIDHIYMEACMAMNGQGGWPLSCFLDNELLPFYAGTYFPKRSSYGMAGFDTILEAIADMWKNDRSKLLKTGETIIRYMAKRLDTEKEELDEEILDKAFSSLYSDFDSDYGGFGSAPKFPALQNILFLLRYGIQNKNDSSNEIVKKTLDSMAKGGIFDHIGGGFSRYSTDKKWLVPHFEKMLYDNAMAIIAYTEAGELVSDKFFAVAKRIIEYLKREMQDTTGGFYTAQDADSEGVEGKYYLWTVKEIVAALGDDDGYKFCDLYDITSEGNFEDTNIPNLIGKEIETDNTDISRECFKKLLKARNMRIPPFKDDKILASGNGIMTAALSIAGRVMKDFEYIRMAERCAQFILNKLIKDNRLMSSYRDGKASSPATSDDYAYVIWGFIELYQSTFKPKWLKGAVELTSRMNELFWDDDNGGYFMSGNDVFDVIIRQKNIHDGALPSGNSVMVLNLIHLARLTFEFKYEDKANEIIRSLSANINQSPTAFTGILSGLLFLENGGEEIVLSKGEGSEKLMDELPAFHPFSTVMFIDENDDELSEIAPNIIDMKPIQNKAAVYICKKGSCNKPITDIDELRERLSISDF